MISDYQPVDLYSLARSTWKDRVPYVEAPQCAAATVLDAPRADMLAILTQPL